MTIIYLRLNINAKDEKYEWFSVFEIGGSHTKIMIQLIGTSSKRLGG